MDVKIEIKGVEELLRRLHGMQQDMAAKALLSSAYSAMLPMERKAEEILTANGSVRTGLLKKSISRVKKVYAKDDVIFIGLGVDKSVKGVNDKGAKVWPLRYAHLVEFGPKSFMRPAYKQTAQTVLDRYTKVLEAKLKKAGL